MQHQLKNQLDAAAAVYREILAEQPDQPDANHLLGLVYSELEDDVEAVRLMERALDLYPSAPHFHHNIAGVYRRIGRLEDAEREFRAAIDLKPDYGEAYQGLAEMVKFSADDPLVERVTGMIESGGLENRTLSYFNFAAGKIFDDIGQFRRAFQYYLEGNRLADRKFSSADFRQQIKDTLYAYSPSSLRRWQGAGSDSRVPTFIVGMPRSGTTLVEQILASHSGVFGAGELNDMKFIVRRAGQLSLAKQAYPNCIPQLQRIKYRQLGETYLKRLAGHTDGGDYLRVVDKHPLNFQFVGLILTMFPNAKIVHTVRNPLDTCLSCFFQNFTKGQDYSFDLTTLAHFYNDYHRLMEHWQSLFGERIHTISYDDMVSDQEATTRRLLDFMELPFEEACINFHETDRKVSTASFLQVRKPLYNSSRQRWVNYRRELAELANIIGVRIEQPVTISGQTSILSSS